MIKLTIGHRKTFLRVMALAALSTTLSTFASAPSSRQSTSVQPAAGRSASHLKQTSSNQQTLSGMTQVAAAGARQNSKGRPFTVADSIALTRVVYVDGLFQAANCYPASSQNYCVVILRRGSVATGLNEFTLRLFKSDELLSYVNAGTEAKTNPWTDLVSFSTDDPEDAIDQVTWGHDGKEILFIGRGAGVKHDGQVFSVNVATGKLKQLTHHPHNIIRFAQAQDTLAFVAKEPPDFTARNKYGYVVDGQFLEDVMASDPNSTAPVFRTYLLNTQSGVSRPAALDEPNRNYPVQLSISPSGRWVVVTHFLRSMPATWGKYALVKQNYGANEPAELSEDGKMLVEKALFGRLFGAVFQYMLVDTATGNARPLIDAPSRLGPIAISWSNDGEHLTLGHTHIPDDLCATLSQQVCSDSYDGLVGVDLATGATSLLDPSATSSVTRTNWRSSTEVEVELDGKQRATYRRASRAWTRAATEPLTQDGPRTEIVVREDVDLPPQLWAVDRVTGRERMVADLNKDLLERVDLGHSEPFSWRSEKLQYEFHGNLLFPPGPRPEKPLPLVIQDYGISPKRFLADGPTTTAYAARALAARNILVLDVGCWARPERLTGNYDSEADAPRGTECYESAVAALQAKGLADPAKVGLIGFSAAGAHVMHAITFGHTRYAAATIADSYSVSPWAYAWSYGTPRPGMTSFDEDSTYAAAFVGTSFFGQGVSEWVRRAPVFNLDRVRTPLRYEVVSYTPDVVAGVGYWDVYTNLRRNKRPVEMIRLPHDAHALQTPFKRFLSQQGNVDWYAYWLKGEERAAPMAGTPETAQSLREQYARWDTLKAEHEAVMKEPPPPPLP